MKRKILLLFFVIIMLGTVSMVAYSARVTNEKKESYNQETLELTKIDDVQKYVEENAVSELTTKLNVPVYSDDDLLYDNEGCFIFGRDAGFYRNCSVRGDLTNRIFVIFPAQAARRISDESTYIMYDSESGYRVYAYVNKASGYFCLEGFPIIMKEKLSYSDFENINVGTSIDVINHIDGIIPIYIERFDNFTDAAIENYTKEGAPLTSIHLLSDGILKIEYARNLKERYIVTNVVYSKDFILSGFSGETCYQISTNDYIK